MPIRGWPGRGDELSAKVVIGIAVVAGGAAALALLFFAVMVVAGVVHALFPYWPWILAAIGLLVLWAMVDGYREAASMRAWKRRQNPPPLERPMPGPPETSVAQADPVSWKPSDTVAPVIWSSGTSIDWHAATKYRCRSCGHNWTSHGEGRGTCSVEGPPYTTTTTIGWGDSLIETESGTPCGCARYEGPEPS